MQAAFQQPQYFGLPSQEQLSEYNIWDSYFTASLANPSGIVPEIERTMPTIEKGAIRRSCIFAHVGLGTAAPDVETLVRNNSEIILAPYKRWPDRFLGLIHLNANDVQGSLDALNRWLIDGPMVGVYFPGGARGALCCAHRNFDPIVARVAELGGLIMQHTWFDATEADGQSVSTPTDLAVLAGRFPQVHFVCAHAGGEWEQGIRAICAFPNISVETSGFDPTAGFIDMAVRELTAKRIIFGSHLPSRSLGTEFGKILGARLSEADRQQILGANLRNLLAPILRKKGLKTS